MTVGDELLTVDEVAERVKVNPETVRRWIKSGKLPAVKAAGGPYRIHSTDLDRLFGAVPKEEPPSRSPETAAAGDSRSLEERIALACVRSWAHVMDQLSERFEELASPGEFNKGQFDATDWDVGVINTGLNIQLSELRSLGIDPLAGAIGDEFDESWARLASAQWKALETNNQAFTTSELAQYKQRQAERESARERLKAETG
jgi:excisionase family DNA binding protein